MQHCRTVLAMFILALTAQADAQTSLVPQSGVPEQAAEPTPPSIPGKQNAALLYYQAKELLPIDDSVALQQAWTNLGDKDLPDAATIELLSKVQPTIRQVMDATKVDSCDWGIQYEQGWKALLPQLGLLRNYARLICLDARRCLAKDDRKGAAERLASLYALSRHSSNGDVLICSLVGVAVESLAKAEATRQLDNGRLDVESARIILNAARANVVEDVHHFKAAIRMERYLTVEKSKSIYSGDDAAKQFLRDFAAMTEMPEESAERVTTMTKEQLHAEFDRLNPYYDKALELWDEADAPAKLDQLAKDFVEKSKSPLFPIIVPTFGRANVGMQKQKAELDAFVKRFEAFVRGEQAPAAGVSSAKPAPTAK